ncbi:MAG: serine hydrolase domain-containing protein [Oscillospiraceae bacterium]
MNMIKGNTEVTPAEAGYDESRLAALHKHFGRLMDRRKIQGASYCLARDGKVFASGAVGRRHYADATDPMLPDTVVRVASVTKLFTAVAVMKLIEDGHFRLDTPVKELLPEFDQGDFWRITVKHLLTHTSGMLPDAGYPDVGGDYLYWDAVGRYIDGYDPEKDGAFNWIHAALQAGVRRMPDEEWMYCSFGFKILGEIITRVSGRDVKAYIEEEIFRPLGMNDSTFTLTPALAKRMVVKSAENEAYLKRVIDGTNQPDNEKNGWKSVPSTDNGVYSTTADLIKFGTMCLGMGRSGDVRILGRKLFEKMTTCALHGVPNFAWGVNDPDRSFGIGFDMKRNAEYYYSEGSFFHEGAGACALIMDPKERMAAAYFVPFDDVPDGWCPEAVYNTQIVIWSGLV